VSEHKLQSVLITGGAGFIGSNFVRLLLAERPEAKIVNLDALTYAGNLANVADLESNPNYTFVRGDICDADLITRLLREHQIESVFHLAAESHVDRSILSAAEFIRTNVAGTETLLSAARAHGVQKFVHISTDEVYGTLGETGKFREDTPIAPNSPYSASKAGSDLVCRAFYETYHFPVSITRCSNNYGPYQFPEKLIPLMIIKAMKGEKLPVYGDGMNVRDWIHVTDHNRAVLAVAEKGRDGEVYNIGADNEWPNIKIVKKLLELLGKGEDLITYVKDRPGHDLRYAIDASKIKTELGWKPLMSFDTALKDTVDWYLGHQTWWQEIMSGEYLNYYEQNYASKL
jgi:dTDP-glucose 4,6-dehydratase